MHGEDGRDFQLTRASAWRNEQPEVVAAVSSTDGAGGRGPGVVERLLAVTCTEWTLSEDNFIRRGVQRLGCNTACDRAWLVIAAQLPGRSHDAVRNRWRQLQESAQPPAVRDCTDRLARNEQRTVWTRAEDDTIVQSVTEIGYRWLEIERRLPGRHWAC